jgi:hypothetical protein
MLETVAIVLATSAVGYFAGGVLQKLLGEGWRNSIRGLMMAVAFIAVALYFLVTNWRN